MAVKLYLKNAAPPAGAGDIFYVSRPDGSADGKVDYTAMAGVIGGLLQWTYAPLSHSHTVDALSDASAEGRALIAAADAGAMRTLLGLEVGEDVQAWSANLDAYAAVAPSAAALALLDDADAAAMRATIGAGTGGGDLLAANNLSDVASAAAAGANIRPVESLVVAAGDETTALTVGTGKVTFRAPYAFVLTDVRASVVTAPTGAAIIVDINEGGGTVLSTKLSIDAGEKTSVTAASPAVISDANLADDAEITIDIDQVGSTVAGAGLKVSLIGRRG